MLHAIYAVTSDFVVTTGIKQPEPLAPAWRGEGLG